MPTITRRSILALVPRVEAHPTHAVIDGVVYPGGLVEYEQALERAEAARRLSSLARVWRDEDPSRYERTLGGWA